ncbi:hypothetical protein BTJ39_22405 [Izhakiella australiensis]|uniref:Uncharacterized protein n=2 Tax=Izhakiella australiensis TaxID=1926881 RepID=A0A1S8Y929_9GAMM|nr:hypothetical protein BTJ39_22405 [Izhakiella australiensis]
MDKLRESFEVWLRSEHLFSDEELEWQPERNCYAIYGVHLAWCAWWESRAALFVSNPDNSDIQCQHCADEADERWIEKINEAGISVKGDE